MWEALFYAFLWPFLSLAVFAAIRFLFGSCMLVRWAIRRMLKSSAR